MDFVFLVRFIGGAAAGSLIALTLLLIAMDKIDV